MYIYYIRLTLKIDLYQPNNNRIGYEKVINCTKLIIKVIFTLIRVTFKNNKIQINNQL